ncbi:hypothetical protein BC937DRAFT_86459 [Endogone sp. FLAS-F59071]|nr:hypothetical protein BC937DRAFT_86459 [Endogone sp. FLAS-F59071]|eukprot:RUS13028.1 hypothetical protein BC937DRAFT_86459 [Endogone sp. FLAS-F59071]
MTDYGAVIVQKNDSCHLFAYCSPGDSFLERGAQRVPGVGCRDRTYGVSLPMWNLPPIHVRIRSQDSPDISYQTRPQLQATDTRRSAPAFVRH